MQTTLQDYSATPDALSQGISAQDPSNANAHANAPKVAPHLSPRQDLSATPAPRRLPYQPSQCAEYLHIQAETEALLQKLYLEQHRRHFCEQPSASASIG